jgi:hypothetical protein
MSHRRARLRRLAAASLVAALIVVGALEPALAASPKAAQATTPASEEQPLDGPSIHYEEAQAHASDRIEFEAGGRVTKGFQPRSDDDWPVGGVAPQGLPAGKASGFEIRAGDLAGADSPTNNAAVAGDPAAFTATGPEAAATPASGGNLRREVFGFLPYWEL